MTVESYRDRTKTVTRRLGWAFAKPGDIVAGCEKCQGLPRGGKVVKIGTHKFTNLRWEPLRRMIDDLEYGAKEVVKEGFPDLTPTEFVDLFCKANKCKPDIMVHRMEFEHIGFPIPRKRHTTCLQ